MSTTLTLLYLNLLPKSDVTALNFCSWTTAVRVHGELSLSNGGTYILWSNGCPVHWIYAICYCILARLIFNLSLLPGQRVRPDTSTRCCQCRTNWLSRRIPRPDWMADGACWARTCGQYFFNNIYSKKYYQVIIDSWFEGRRLYHEAYERQLCRCLFWNQRKWIHKKLKDERSK